MTENLLTPGEVLENVEKQVAAPSWLGRQQKRRFDHINKRAQKKEKLHPVVISDVHQLERIDDLLGEEDSDFTQVNAIKKKSSESRCKTFLIN